MGVAITDLLVGKEIKVDDLKNKVLAVDAFNMLYQFITTIRMQDGTPLKDSKGRITSHLIGLFSRTTTLMSQGLKLVFVFDGKPPELKKKEQERRREMKAQALHKFKEAEQAENIEEMKKYAGRTAKLDSQMIQEAKDLLVALGIPVVQAPSEGEAQAAYMCKKGDAYAVISQDADSFLFGAPRVVKNLNLSGRRKKTSSLSYEKVPIELFRLDESLQEMGLTREQLIMLAILVGTDYNRQGIKGIGPKKALKLVKEKSEEAFIDAKWSEEYPDLDWQELYDTFMKMPAIDDYELKWEPPSEEKLRKILVEEHEFSEERITSAMKKIDAGASLQKGLGEFF